MSGGWREVRVEGRAGWMTEQGKVSTDKGGGPPLETRKERMTPIGLSTAKLS